MIINFISRTVSANSSLTYWKNRLIVEKILKIKTTSNKLLKSVWGMPRLSEAMKDAISCEKLRGGAHTF